MNEKLNLTGNSNGTGERGCERGEDLVAYLYGEAAPEAAKSFCQHLTSCAVCRDELAAFGGVREIVGEWRDDALSAVPALGVSESFRAVVQSAPERKRSAVAALREFFSLSPLWLRAGAVAAVLAFCAMTALTLARTEVRWDSNGLAFRTGVQERVIKEQIQAPLHSGYTQEQVDGMIAVERAKWEQEKNQQIEIMKASLIKQNEANPYSDEPSSASRQQNRKRIAPGNSRRGQPNPNRYLAENGSGDAFNTNEERVPRLTDLLGAVNNPK
jgi:hypothetical protein